MPLSSNRKEQGDDDKLTLILPGTRKDGTRLKGFGRKQTKTMKFEEQVDESSDEEYEETLIYVDLDDIPSVDELFAVEPDDFLTCQSKKQREIKKPEKQLHPQLQLKFHNLDSSCPILQIGGRYYSGTYEEPLGSHLMFQEKSSSEPAPSSSKTASTTVQKKLPSLVPELRPPKDKIFGESVSADLEYELVANVHKVLKMTRQQVHFHGEKPSDLPPTPSGQPAPMKINRWPSSYTTTDILSGKYHADKNIPGGPFFDAY